MCSTWHYQVWHSHRRTCTLGLAPDPIFDIWVRTRRELPAQNVGESLVVTNNSSSGERVNGSSPPLMCGSTAELNPGRFRREPNVLTYKDTRKQIYYISSTSKKEKKIYKYRLFFFIMDDDPAGKIKAHYVD